MKDNSADLRYFARARVGDIWRLALEEIELEGEEAVMAEVLKQHPEYYDVWEQAEMLPPNEEVLRNGVNPFIHVAIHTTVENQIADSDPPQTAETLEALIEAGYTRHDAIHAIGSLVTEQAYEIAVRGQPFDEEGYVEALRELVRTSKPPRRRRRPRRPRQKRIH